MSKRHESITQVALEYEEGLSNYFNDLKKYKPLKKEEERKLLVDFKEKNDLVARQKLITHNLRYACSLVNKYKDMGVPISDLIEEANCGLIESIDKFDLSKDVKVITYAKWRIEYYLQEAIRLKEKHKTDALPEEYETQFTEDTNLQEECGIDSNSYKNTAFENEDNVYSEATNNVKSIITVLNEKEQDFIKMYYGIAPYTEEHTYQEIGDKYGITRERVRQIIDKIMRKLRVQALTILTE